MDFIANMSFFWVGVVSTIFLILALISGATKSFGWAVIFVGLTVLFTSLSAYSPLSWIWENWTTALLYLAIYVVIGFVWATFAWFLSLSKAAKEYEKQRARLMPKFLAAKGITKLEDAHFAEFREFLADNHVFLPTERLKLSKDVMAVHVLFWPFQIVTFFLGDALTWAVDAFVGLFGGFFKRIQKWVFRKFPELSN